MKKWYRISNNCSDMIEHCYGDFKEMTEEELEKFESISEGGCSFCYGTRIKEVNESDLVYCMLDKKKIPYQLCYGEEGKECIYLENDKCVY